MGGEDTTNNTADPGGEGSGGGHLVYAEQFGPASAWAVETNDAHTLSRAGCLETLVKYDVDGQLQPMLATEWTQVEPKAWDFTLRDGVTFQDGTPLDAKAVAGALTHVLEVEVPARAFNAEVISKVVAVDESTVRISTPRPDPLVPLRVANPNAGILAPKAYQGKQIDIKGTCTGPFTVTEEVPQQSISLEANENYWGGDVNLDSAEVRFIVDGATRATQLQTGEAQIAKTLPVANVATLEGDDNIVLSELGLARTTVMLLNNSRPPFDDPLVRQAIQYAVDTQAIVDGVYEGSGEPAVGPFGPDTDWAPEGAAATSVDLDKARALLDQAGVDPESLSIELMAYNDRPEFPDVAAVIQDQLGQLGIKVKIKAGEYTALEPDMLSGDFDASLLSRGYLVDVADPGGYLRSDWMCDGGYNIAHYCDPETDQMIEDAVAIEDTDARNQAYGQIADRLQSQAASVFLIHEHAVYGTQSNVTNFQPHPVEYYVLTAELGLD
jgi:peptide/nickel transport system substrate-binding protein